MIKKYIKFILNNLEDTNNKIANLEEKVENLSKQLKNINSSICNNEININNKINDLNNKYLTIDSKLNKFQYVNPELIKVTNLKDKILICGFFGAPNLGDELMLETFLNHLNPQLKNKNISITIMLANNTNYNVLNYYNIDFIHYPHSQYDYENIANYYDKVIFVGGAQIDDTNYEYSYVNEMSFSTTLIELSIRFIKKQKKCYWIGLSSNKKIINKKFIDKLNYIVDNITYISLRDTNSEKTLKNIIRRSQNIKIINDIIIGNETLLINKEKIPEKIKNIGVVLICSKADYEKNIIILKTLLNYCQNSFNKFNINLIPFYNYENNDYKHYKKLLEKIKNENVHLINYVNTYNEIVKIFNKQNYLICERYHSILLGILLNKKILAIEYDIHRHYTNKISYIYEKYCKEKNIIKYSEVEEKTILKNIKYLFERQKDNKIDKKIVLESIKELDDIIKLILE